MRPRGPVATVVDHLPRNVRVAAHAPEEPRRGLPDRDPLVPAQEVEPAQEDHQGDQGAGQHAGDQGTQRGATGQHGDQREEQEEQEEHPLHSIGDMAWPVAASMSARYSPISTPSWTSSL